MTQSIIYKTRSSFAEAFRFAADSDVTGPEWFGQMLQNDEAFIDRALTDGGSRVYGCSLYVDGAKLKARIGDYIVRTSTGELRVMSEKRFEKEYERA